MVRRVFNAMGTSIEVLLDREPSLDTLLGLASTERLFWRLEDSMTRFDSESELSRLNAEGSLDASDDFVAVVELALDARARTGGRFDATMHDAVVAAGYDRSFELISAGAGGPWRAPTRVSDETEDLASLTPTPGGGAFGSAATGSSSSRPRGSTWAE